MVETKNGLNTLELLLQLDDINLSKKHSKISKILLSKNVFLKSKDLSPLALAKYYHLYASWKDEQGKDQNEVESLYKNSITSYQEVLSNLEYNLAVIKRRIVGKKVAQFATNVAVSFLTIQLMNSVEGIVENTIMSKADIRILNEVLELMSDQVIKLDMQIKEDLLITINYEQAVAYKQRCNKQIIETKAIIDYLSVKIN